ncbi:unnamed protein product, partial [Heterosigma akashiwo]
DTDADKVLECAANCLNKLNQIFHEQVYDALFFESDASRCISDLCQALVSSRTGMGPKLTLLRFLYSACESGQ